MNIFGRIVWKLNSTIKEGSELIRHYIIMSSSYIDGTRIALDFTDISLQDGTRIKKVIDEIKAQCGKDVPLSAHLICTESAEWKSVSEYDPFFKDVELVESVSEFSRKISEGRVLSGLDVAKYILTKVQCTHLALQKLVYLAYADYLCEYSEQLFSDEIYAFKYGPVIASVYDVFKKNGMQCIDVDFAVKTDVKEMPARSRILFARAGGRKLESIDRIIDTYGKFSASELVDIIIHRGGSPWSHVKERGIKYE